MNQVAENYRLVRDYALASLFYFHQSFSIKKKKKTKTPQLSYMILTKTPPSSTKKKITIKPKWPEERLLRKFCEERYHSIA